MTQQFRVWDRKWERWITGTDVMVYGDGSFTADRRGEDGGDVIETAESRNGDLILEQYIGIEDVKGIDIYEGDIVRQVDEYYDKFPPGHELYCAVVKRTQSAGLIGFYPGTSDLEVIGNIHENPELLEVK